MGKSPYEIIKTIIDRLIIRQYPFLEIVDIDSFAWMGHRSYSVNFLTSEKLDSNIQMEIDTEIKQLFKMTGLDSDPKEKTSISVWFKAPGEKDFTFTSDPTYKHH